MTIHAATESAATQPAPPRRVGVMFGSYNPPHLGHIKLAIQARQQTGADKIVMVPINSPIKTHIPQAEYEHKIAMCRILTRPHQSWLRAVPVANDHTVERTTGLRAYFRFFADFFGQHPDSDVLVICGEDNTSKMKKLCSLMNVKGKAEGAFRSIFNMAANGNVNPVPLNVFSMQRATVSSTLNGKDVSSSQLRRALEEGVRIPPQWVKREILDYIAKNRIYQNAP